MNKEKSIRLRLDAFFHFLERVGSILNVEQRRKRGIGVQCHVILEVLAVGGSLSRRSTSGQKG